jgi:uncharacterized protein YjbI with pentapeptide repeats
MMTMQESVDIAYPNPESKDEIYSFLKWCSDNNASVEWNNWRIRNLLTTIDISKLDLSGLKLDFIDFKATNLSFCDLSNTSLEGATFDIGNLEGANMTGVNLAESSLRNVSMLGANLIGANLILANFEASDLTGAHLSNANLTGVNMERTCLKGVSFENANLRNVNFKNADMRIALMVGVDLSTADLSNVNFTGANLSGVDLTVVDISTLNLTSTNLTGANLSGVDFSNINLANTILSSADMSEAILTGVSLVNQEMIDTNLTGAELMGADLTNAKLLSIKGLGTDFSNAIMLGCDLTNADLEGAIMQSANLEGANLEGANLEEANLRAANLTDTNLYGTDLTDTVLTGAMLTGTHLENVDKKEEAPQLSENEQVKETMQDIKSINKMIDKPASIDAIEEKLKEITKKNIEIEKAKLEQSTVQFDDDLSNIEQPQEIKESVESVDESDISDIEEIEKHLDIISTQRKEQLKSEESIEPIKNVDEIVQLQESKNEKVVAKEPKKIENNTNIQEIKTMDIKPANIELNNKVEKKEVQTVDSSEYDSIKTTSVIELLRKISKIDAEASNEEIYELVHSIAFKLSYSDSELEGDITMPYIDMLKSYQENIYLTYLSFVGRREELTYLTKREKNALELKFKVDANNSIYIIPYKIDYIVKNMIECAIGPKEILLSVCAIVGYLPTKFIKKAIKEKLEETDDTITDTFIRVSRRLKNSEAKDKKIEVILKPIDDNSEVSLKTRETTFTNKSLATKTTSKRIEEIEIEDEFLVDGVKGLSSRKSTFYLVNDEDSYEVKVGIEQSDVKDILLQNLRKTVSATICIEKVNDEVVRQSIIDIE